MCAEKGRTWVDESRWAKIRVQQCFRICGTVSAAVFGLGCGGVLQVVFMSRASIGLDASATCVCPTHEHERPAVGCFNERYASTA